MAEKKKKIQELQLTRAKLVADIKNEETKLQILIKELAEQSKK